MPFFREGLSFIGFAILFAVVIAGLFVVFATGDEWRDAITLREAEGKGLRIDHFVKWGLWRAAVLEVILAAGLLVVWLWKGMAVATKREENCHADSTGTGSAGKKRSCGIETRSRIDDGGGRRWWFAVFLLVVLAVGIRWPRMDLSLYNDEVSGFTRYVGGWFEGGTTDLKNEEPAEFAKASWLDTVWGNRQANNHGLYSVLARVCYDSWKTIKGAVPGEIGELPLRLPALFGGLIGVMALAGLGRAMGFPLGGLFAALLAAVHPWHLRYSTEARGYGLLLGLVVLAAWCLVRALQDERAPGESIPRGKWKWWLLYALSQSAYLWSNLGGVYLAAGINGVVLLALAVATQRRQVRGLRALVSDGSIHRLLMANVVSAMILIPLVLPCVPQIASAIERNEVFRAGVPFGFWPDVINNLLIGMPWYDGDPENAMNPAVLKYGSRPGTWVGIVVAALSFFAGLGVILWRSGIAATVVVGALVGLILAWANAEITGATLLPWYVIFVLPFVLLCTGCGVSSLAQGLGAAAFGSGRNADLSQRYIGYALVAGIAWAGYPALSAYQKIGKQALRNAIFDIRGGTYPFTAEQRHPIVTGWWTEAGIYDPGLRAIWKVDQMEWMIAKAQREQRPMYFILGKREAALAENAAVIEILEGSGRFELLGFYPGLEQRAYRETVFKLRDSK